MTHTRFARLLALSLLALVPSGARVPDVPAAAAPRFLVSFPRERSATPLDGRLLLLISADSSAEPRFQIEDGPSTQLVFGIDVDALAPGREAVVDEGAFGYPLRSLSALPAGRYRVQALLNRYETFRRSDGHVVKLPPDRGEGQQWNRKPGNLYSVPRWVTVGGASSEPVRLTMDQEIPPIADPPATKYIKHERIQSKLLTEFWGRPMYLGAHVLLPQGFDEHPNARYPLVIDHGHFPYTFSGFREEPPDSTLAPDSSARFRLKGYNRIQQQLAHQLYKDWTGPGFPRVLLIQIQHPTPYYDDSYAVNSANNGPYGDAIMRELIPHIERKYRGLGQGWARFTYGGSTGGWEAMAVQMFYPDEFNGAWIACPDPIDFRAFTLVNLYQDRNAYYLDSRWKRTERPGHRDWLGHVSTTVRDMNHLELALGTKGRSGGQWDIWQAVYSPVGADGYPRPIWDKLTGEIDRAAATYWRDHYDLSYILRRDWKTLGPKLRGKLHIYVGDMDNYYLNNAVYLVEEFLEGSTDPPYEGEVDYGDRAEHCWNGDHTRSNAYSRLRYAQMFIPRIVNQIRKNHPAGADTTSWRY
ncbi:MAG TPA: hypothetical protein VJ803_00925 [Gemmatimonadaceae bacterium]|nr:hypothetical protein [Gemmatimonadaceae bacterium]